MRSTRSPSDSSAAGRRPTRSAPFATPPGRSPASPKRTSRPWPRRGGCSASRVWASRRHRSSPRRSGARCPPTSRNCRPRRRARTSSSTATAPVRQSSRRCAATATRHSDWSDGGSPIREMAEAARALGREYLVLTDHSARLTVAHGLDEERLRRQLDDRRRAQRGAGAVPHPDRHGGRHPRGRRPRPGRDLLAELDVVVASVHSKLRMEAPQMTARMIAAIESPHTDILGHCTGRLIVGRGRPQSTFDAEAVFAACARTGTAVEINSRPERQDPPEDLLRLAHRARVHVRRSTPTPTPPANSSGSAEAAAMQPPPAYRRPRRQPLAGRRSRGMAAALPTARVRRRDPTRLRTATRPPPRPRTISDRHSSRPALRSRPCWPSSPAIFPETRGCSTSRSGTGFAASCSGTETTVELGSRNEKPLTRYFPELVDALQRELPDAMRRRR